MTQLYCGDCQNYLMGSDGQCHDCSCGWNQPVETYEKENTELETEVARLQKENENLAHRLNNAQDSAIKALEENAAQAKRIAELEAATEYQDTCTDGGKCGAGGYCKDCIQEPTKDE